MLAMTMRDFWSMLIRNGVRIHMSLGATKAARRFTVLRAGRPVAVRKDFFDACEAAYDEACRLMVN